MPVEVFRTCPALLLRYRGADSCTATIMKILAAIFDAVFCMHAISDVRGAIRTSKRKRATWLRMSQAATYSAIVGAITLVGCNAAQAQLSVRIIEKGVYKAETIARTVTKEATGVLNTVVNPRLISEGVVVYGNLGVRFGIRYVVSGAATTDVDLRFVIRFPPAGLRDPKGLRYSASEQSQSVQTGGAHYWDYQLENDWEIVQGAWHFEIWSNANKLAQQTFCVLDARQAVDANNTKECLPFLMKLSNEQGTRGTDARGRLTVPPLALSMQPQER